MILCDTNVIIETLKGNKKIITTIELIGLENVAMSSVTVMELYFGAFDKNELQKIKKYLNCLNIIHIDPIISKKAINLIELYAKSHNLNIPDSLIASTALLKKMKLFTYNLKDFKYIEKLQLYKS